MPRMALSVLDLPAPLEPISATVSPASSVSATPSVPTMGP